MRILMLIIDGLGDKRYKELGGKTPLEAANTLNLDEMGIAGETGLMHTLGPGITPGSDTAHLALFGYDPLEYYQGRGVYEALGAGLELEPGDLCIRTNFATLEDGKIVDRRAGRNDYGYDIVEKMINKELRELDNVTIKFKHTTEHRGVLVLKGKDLSPDVTDNDPHKTGLELKKIEPIEKTDEAMRTAKLLNKIVSEIEKILEESGINEERRELGLPEANTVLMRGPGIYQPVPLINEIFDLDITFSAVAGGSLYKGVARFVGMEVLDVPGATGDKNTDLEAKARAAINTKSDFVFLHVKATDSFSHDRDVLGKKEFIERIDKELVSLVKNEFDLIFVSGDHSTFCSIGEHTADPLPLLIYGDESVIRQDNGRFNEIEATTGQHRIIGLDVMPILLSKGGYLEKWGS